MPDRVPDRLRWAVDELDPAPGDHVLEIGCGPGVAAALILQRLSAGTLTAVDRSAAAIARAGRRNEAAVRAGKASFHAVAVEDADFGERRFDRVLAVNVNRFWLRPADESALWARLLKPGARVCLVYEPPSAPRVDPVAAACSDYFRRSGFADVAARRAEGGTSRAVSIRAAWR